MHFFTNYSKTTRISFIRGSQSSMLPVASTVVIVTVAGSRRSRRDRPSTLPTSSKLPVVIAILATTTPVTEIHNRCRRQKSPVGIHTGWTLPPQPLAPSWGGGREFSVISREENDRKSHATPWARSPRPWPPGRGRCCIRGRVPPPLPSRAPSSPRRGSGRPAPNGDPALDG